MVIVRYGDVFLFTGKQPHRWLEFLDPDLKSMYFPLKNGDIPAIAMLVYWRVGTPGCGPTRTINATTSMALMPVLPFYVRDAHGAWKGVGSG